MQKWISRLRLFTTYVRLNCASILEYRQSFFAAAFGMLLSNGTFVFFWKIAFLQIGGRIGGYDFEDVMFIWAAASSAFGLAYIILGNLGNLGGLIISGELDVYLLQPRDPLLSLLCSRTELTAWGDLAYGFLLMLLTNNTAKAWGGFGVAILFGSILYAATAVFFNSLTFFFGDSSLASGAALEFVLNFTIYPEGIYHKAIRILMYSLIPGAYITHVPLRIARAGSLWWIPVLAGFTAAYSAFAYWVFTKGLKRYESGNLIGTRT